MITSRRRRGGFVSKMFGAHCRLSKGHYLDLAMIVVFQLGLLNSPFSISESCHTGDEVEIKTSLSTDCAVSLGK